MSEILEFCKSENEFGYLSDEPFGSDGENQTGYTPSTVIVKHFMNDLRIAAKLAIVISKLSALRAIATELFDSISAIEVLDDPEIEDAKYVTITVRAKGDVRGVANLRREWYRKIHDILGGQEDLVHLAIDIIE